MQLWEDYIFFYKNKKTAIISKRKIQKNSLKKRKVKLIVVQKYQIIRQ